MNWNLSTLRRVFKPVRQRTIRNRRNFRPRVESLETRLAPANINITSFHYDPSIQGQDTQETDLTPINVNSSLFGKLASVAVDGYTYAQPVYLHGLMIGGNPHDVAFVSTEHDSVYAFDIFKNATTGAVTITQLWQRSFITGGPGGPTTPGITSVPQPDVISGDIVPEIGITGGPAIDAATGTLYLVAKTKEVRGDGNHWVQTIHALNVTTGGDRTTPFVIGDTHTSATFANETTAITVPGAGAESGGTPSMVPFSALKENQRPSLQLLNGRVYVGWASHGDNTPYHGWVVGFNETTLQPEKIYCTNPNGNLSGIWQSEGALSTDGRYIYFAVGNGGGAAGFAAWDPAHGNYSESVEKIDTQATGTIMPVADYFTPWNWPALDSADADLGSGGVMLLPDSVGSAMHMHLMVETGKDGHIYLLDRDNMGQLVPGQQDNRQIVQDVVGGPGGVWGNPSYYQESATSGLIFYHGSGSDSRVFRISNGQITQVAGSFIAYRSNQTFGFPGANPVISANGVNNPSSAIDWEVQLDNYGSQGPATLHAYSLPSTPTGTLTELYNSNQAGTRDQLSASVKFTSAIVTNGLVFVAQGGGAAAGNPASGTFNVFGEFPPPTQAPAAPTSLTAMGVATNTIQLNWNNPSPQPGAQATAIQVWRSIGDDQHFGTTPLISVSASATSYTDTVTDPNQVYFYKVRAHNTFMGGSDSAFSNTASATPFVQPVLSLVNAASNAVVLSWTRPPVANDHFNVERSTTVDFASPTIIATGLSGTTLTYTDNSAALVSSPGTYYYRIRAFSTPSAIPFALSNIVGVKVGPQAGVINYGPPNGFPSPPAPTPFDLHANGDAQFAETTARLTNAAGQTGGVFSTSQENILNWTSTFNVRLHEGTQPYYANGFAFVIQALGGNTLGQGLTGLGYQGIPNSLALTFDTFTNGFSPTDPTRGGAVGLFVNGHNPGGTPGTGDTRILLDPTTAHVDLDSQSTKTITLTYAYNAASPDASILHEVLVDTGPGPSGGGTFTHDYTVNIPALLGIPANGNTTAYVGFTGSTGSIVGQPGMQAPGWELQDILNWVYTPNGPAAPNHLSVVSGTSTNTLSWRTTSADDGPAPAGYYVERSTSPSTGFSRITTLGPGVVTFTDTGLTNPRQYYYRVQQFNHNGTGGAELDSGYSNVATGNAVTIPFATGFPNTTGLTTNGFGATNPLSGTALRMTDSHTGEARSAFFNTPIGTGAFTTTFMLKDVPQTGSADSVSFVIQNDPAGLHALGGGGGAGGYAGINNSIAIKFDLYSGGTHTPTTGLYTNGTSPGEAPGAGGGRSIAMTPINLGSGDPMQVTLNYDGTSLTETVLDTITSAFFSHTYVGPPTLAQIIGSPSAFVGFTGGTGGETALQDIQSWSGQFAKAPPAATTLNVSATPTSITAGANTNVTVSVLDQDMMPFPSYTGTVHFTSTDPQAVFINAGQPLVGGNYTFTAADMGTHTFQVTLKTAGSQTITANDTVTTTVRGTSNPVTVSPGALSALSLSGFPAVIQPGTPGSFTLAAKDAFGNTVPTYTGTVHFTSSDPAAALPGDPVTHNYMFVPADMGQHVFSATLNTLGTQSITATDTVTTTVTGTQSGIIVNQAGTTVISFPNGFADQTNLTANGSTTFVGPVGLFPSHQDIGTAGNPSPAGSAAYNFATGAYTITASGSDIWDPNDHFHYTYEPLNGNAEIIARVTGIGGTDGWAKAGVMIRATTDTASPHESMDFSFGNGSSQQWRDTQGGGSASFDQGAGTAPIPGWVRLVRSGNDFTGYWATDVNGAPGTWHTAGTHTTVMPANVLIGLCVTAHNNGALNTTTFDHVTVTGNTPPLTNTIARLTDANNSEAASLFYNTPVSAGAFSTTFQFQMRAGTNPIADGMTFVIQNDPRGVNALGQGGGAMGYGTDANDGALPAIQNSLAIKFDAYKGFNTGDGNHSSTGLYVGGFRPNNPGSGTVPPGAVPVDLAGTGIDFNAAAQAATPHNFQVTLSYDGATLMEMIKDLTTSVTFSHNYTVNIPQVIGGNAAFVGFTAGTGGLNAFMDLQSWTGNFQQGGIVNVNFPNFTNHSTLTANTIAVLPPLNVFPTTPPVMRLTDDRGGEGTAVFLNSPIGTGSFTTSFTLQDTGAASADSLSFVIQNDPRGLGALGTGGGGGGYAGITNSIAVKFDLWNHNTHAPYSTGLFSGGEAPDGNPSKDVSLAPINLASGNPIRVSFTYDGTTLRQDIQEMGTTHVFTHSYPLNLAQVIGGNSAYVGFTAGTGGATSTQDIVNWAGVFAPPKATKLALNAPATVTGGTAFQITVTAQNQNNNTLTGYLGRVHFTSSDPVAVLPGDYTFVPADNGVHTFTVTLKTFGNQTITVTDTAIATVTATATISVPLDFSNGFGNTGNLMANGSAAFVGPSVPGSPVGIFTNHTNIGTPGDPTTGNATFANGAYTLTSTGSDIWDVADHMHYAYEPLVGDGQIIARVVNPSTAPDFWTKAGVMIRGSLLPGAPDDFMLYTPQVGHQEPVMQFRDSLGATTADSRAQVAPLTPAPIWLRLVREGNVFTGFWATDNNGTPNTWQQITAPHTTFMPSMVYVGLGLTSHNNGSLATVTFDHVQVTGNTNAPTAVARITDGGNGEAGSVFTKTKVPANSFTTTFTFKDQAVNAGGADSMSFVLQNDPAGAAALGNGGGGGGYQTINNSIAIKFDLWTNASHVPTTGLFINGQSPSSGDQSPTSSQDVIVNGISFLSGDPIQVNLTYNGTTLTETITDTVTHATFTHDYLVNLQQILGGTVAYAGFTAGTGGASAVQDVLSWTYQSIPVPPTTSLLVTPFPTNLVTNGGFETGDYTGWTRTGDTSLDSVIHESPPDPTHIHSGVFASRLGPNNLVFLSQTLSTITGANYSLDFWLSNPLGGTGTEWLVSVGGNTLVDAHNAPAFNYRHFTFSFTATSTSTVLQFGFAHPPDWWYLDDVSVTQTSLVAGTTAPVTVTAVDAGGHRVGYTGTVHITTTDPQIPDFGTYMFTPADNGQHTFTGGTLETAGTQTVTFRDTVNSSIVGSTNILVTANPQGTHFTLTGTPPTPSGSQAAVVVTARDAFGNIIPGYRGTVHFTSSDGGAALPNDYTFTAGDNGSHAFGVQFVTVGTQTLTATDNTVPTPLTGTESVTVTPASFFVGGFPSEITAGASGSITVIALDANNNVADGYRGTVQFSSTSAGTLPMDYTFTAGDAGVHIFSNVVLTTAGVQYIIVTDPLTPNQSTGYQSTLVDPAAATHLTIGGFPTTVTAGDQNFVTVTAFDQYNNVATGYTGTVHLTSNDPAMVNSGDSPLFNGQGTFSVTLFTESPPLRSITATDTVTPSLTATQDGITVNSAAPFYIFVTTPYPSPVTAGTAHPITITIADVYGNPVTNYSGTVHVSSSDPQVAAFDYPFVAADHGVHTFSLTLFTADTQSIFFADTTASIFSEQDGIQVTAGAAAGFRVVGYPPSISTFDFEPVTVMVVDNWGNRVTNFHGTVDLSTNPGATAFFSDSGHHTFTDDDAGMFVFQAAFEDPGTYKIFAVDTVDHLFGQSDDILVS